MKPDIKEEEEGGLTDVVGKEKVVTSVIEEELTSVVGEERQLRSVIEEEYAISHFFLGIDFKI